MLTWSSKWGKKKNLSSHFLFNLNVLTPDWPVCPLPQERFVIQVTDLLTVSMMLGITAQVKEAGIAWDKGEKKSECCALLVMLYFINHLRILGFLDPWLLCFQIWRAWGRFRIRLQPSRETLCGGCIPSFRPSAKLAQKTTFTGQ